MSWLQFIIYLLKFKNKAILLAGISQGKDIGLGSFDLETNATGLQQLVSKLPEKECQQETKVSPPPLPILTDVLTITTESIHPQIL